MGKRICGLGLVMLLAGCMNMTASLQPENLSVKDTYIARDCVVIVFGFANGRASVEGALANLGEANRDLWSLDLEPVPPRRITKIRRVQFTDMGFIGFGERCVEVVGEP